MRDDIMMRTLVAIFLAVLSANCWAQKYVYTSRIYGYGANQDSGPDRFVIDVEAQRVRVTHTSTVFLECEAEYVCIRSLPFHFAIPRSGGLRQGQKWQSEGVPFEVTGAEDFAVLGQHVPVFVIASRRTATLVEFFYYSESRGLLAIRTTESGNHPIPYIDLMIIEGEKGFPF